MTLGDPQLIVQKASVGITQDAGGGPGEESGSLRAPHVWCRYRKLGNGQRNPPQLKEGCSEFQNTNHTMTKATTTFARPPYGTRLLVWTQRCHRQVKSIRAKMTLSRAENYIRPTGINGDLQALGREDITPEERNQGVLEYLAMLPPWGQSKPPPFDPTPFTTFDSHQQQRREGVLASAGS